MTGNDHGVGHFNCEGPFVMARQLASRRRRISGVATLLGPQDRLELEKREGISLVWPGYDLAAHLE